MNETLVKMRERWPSAAVSRKDVAVFSGGLVSSKFLANHDSAGTGPAKRFKVGKTVAYDVDALLAWLQERLTQKEVQA